jgi:hypothetical protein
MTDMAGAEMKQEVNPKLIRPGSSSCLSFIPSPSRHYIACIYILLTEIAYPKWIATT